MCGVIAQKNCAISAACTKTFSQKHHQKSCRIFLGLESQVHNYQILMLLVLKSLSMHHSCGNRRNWSEPHWSVESILPVNFPLLISREYNKRYFYRTQVSLGSGLWVPVSLTPSKSFAKLYYVTLADDDTNSILADDANRAIWGWWLSFRWWASPMWAWRSPRGSARWW